MERQDLLEGAEPFEIGSGELGVLLVHGFTGCPQSMRLWGESLASKGFTVSCPLLPGHGTEWQDLQQTGWREWVASAREALDSLTARCDRVFVGGLSMGGTITYYLAATAPEEVKGIVPVSAALVSRDPRLIVLPVLKHFVPSLPGIANDIADTEHSEVAYDRVPLRALSSLLELQAETRKRLRDVTCPALIFHSRQDHVVEPENMGFAATRLGSSEVRLRWLERSFHVATLDVEREQIFSESAAFFTELTS